MTTLRFHRGPEISLATITEAGRILDQHAAEVSKLQARVVELEGALREAARLEQWEPENVWAHLSEWAE